MGPPRGEFVIVDKTETYRECPQCGGPMLVTECDSGYVWAQCESCGYGWDDPPKGE